MTHQKRKSGETQCYVSVRGRNGRARERALAGAIELRREDTAAEGNAAIQSHRGKVSALRALRLHPGLQRGQQARQAPAKRAQQTEIVAYGADLAAVMGAFRAELEKLQQAGEILAARRRGKARDFLRFHGQGLCGGSGHQRAA